MENLVTEPALQYHQVSPKAYLAGEIKASEKHEYFEGTVIKMQGASLIHEDIVANLVREIRIQLKGKDCRIRGSNLRVAPPDFLSYMYPDATIGCGTPLISADEFDVLQNPTIIFEVVSPSGAGNDYRRKWLYYRQIPSLKQYVLISSYEKMQIDLYIKNVHGTWIFQSLLAPDQILEFSSFFQTKHLN